MITVITKKRRIRSKHDHVMNYSGSLFTHAGLWERYAPRFWL